MRRYRRLGSGKVMFFTLFLLLAVYQLPAAMSLNESNRTQTKVAKFCSLGRLPNKMELISVQTRAEPPLDQPPIDEQIEICLDRIRQRENFCQNLPVRDFLNYQHLTDLEMVSKKLILTDPWT